MTDQPATYEMFDSRLKRLGLAANIGVHLTSYAFRRLAANAVNRPEVTVEDRRSLMGHNIASRVFRAYIARTTQVDVQGLVTKGSVDRTALASAGRLSHAYDLPKAISAKGKASVFARQDVQDLSAKIQVARLAFAEAHPGLSLRLAERLQVAEAVEHRELVKDRETLTFGCLRAGFLREVQSNSRREGSCLLREEWCGKSLVLSLTRHQTL